MEVFMLGRKQRRHTVVETLVGSNTRISGDLHFTGGCHIDGTVNGNVTADPDSQAALSISEAGNVDGGVTVPYVVLNGIVRGDVFASQRVELGPTARVIGNVYAPAGRPGSTAGADRPDRRIGSAGSGELKRNRLNAIGHTHHRKQCGTTAHRIH
jgi:cytoskeletal protein CcmA (bactofilin family)